MMSGEQAPTGQERAFQAGLTAVCAKVWWSYKVHPFQGAANSACEK